MRTNMLVDPQGQNVNSAYVTPLNLKADDHNIFRARSDFQVINSF